MAGTLVIIDGIMMRNASGGLTTRRNIRRRLLAVSITIFAIVLLQSLFFALSLNEGTQVLKILVQDEALPQSEYTHEQFKILWPANSRTYEVCAAQTTNLALGPMMISHAL